VQAPDEEEELLRSVALKNAQSILQARQRAEQQLSRANEALERRTQELAHSLSLMRATLESTTDAILVTDVEGRVMDFNENYLRIWKLSREFMAGADLGALLRVNSEQFRNPGEFVARIEDITASSPPETFDLLELADGRALERFSRIRVANGQRAGRVWSFREITERLEAEEALRDETRILELLNRTGTTLASELDVHALLQTVTDAATELAGAQFGALFYNKRDENNDTYMLYTLSGAPREAFEKLGHPRATPLFGPTFRGEGTIRCDDVLSDARYGTMTPHRGMPAGHLPVRSYLAVPVVSRSAEVIGGLFFGHPEPGRFTERDERLIVGVAAQAAVAIDNARLYEAAQHAAEERKHLLESERAARAEAERTSAIKDEFLATLSHELRTPLSAILGWSQVLRRRNANDADLIQGLETIERNARAQTQLIEDLLDMSRITLGKVRLDIQPVEPVSFIEAAVETVRPAAEAKGIRLEKQLDQAAGPISGDPHRLQQVIWNLLTNAIKFTQKDGKVQLLLERVNSHIEISVTDTGVGIEPRFLPHVFERFRQADASATRRFGGLGLGLAIVKHLVELHGGTVRVHSLGENRGTTFVVQLPVMAVHRHPGAEPRLHPAGPVAGSVEFRISDLTGIKVLVVDDEPDARNLIKRVLEECRAQVLSAGSADEAILLVEKERPDVLVSDIGMPDMDGYELLRRVRALGPSRGGRVPAIALTAFARSEDRTRALRAGFLIHVAKPVEPSELVASVASVTGRTGELDPE
jgi:PAS domain S-box-containing protein